MDENWQNFPDIDNDPFFEDTNHSEEWQAVEEIIHQEESEEPSYPIYCPVCGHDLCFEVEEVWKGKCRNILAMKDAIYCPHCGWEYES